jgi:hypothetical protein
VEVIRPATAADADAIVSLGVESVSIDPLPVTIDRRAMRATFLDLVGKPHGFAWVAEVDGKVVAGVVAISQPGFWFTRHQCSVLLFYTRVKGAGMPLLRRFAEWVKSRPVIKLAVFELEPGVDPRIMAALKRMGFKRESTNLTYVREA